MDSLEDDFLLAAQLQFEYEQENEEPIEILSSKKVNENISLIDNFWELNDPNPDLHSLFLQFNKDYFWNKLVAVEVKWSTRMTLCAGVCCYEGRSGLCSVKLSLPLLKLRPRKDLVETLLHEMIHAYLFVTHNNKDHDDHGAEFHKHMYRINSGAGTKISVYHNFHDEVDNYRQHWWRCTGPCQNLKPYFGYVRRAMNRPPTPKDRWWADHAQKCNGQFVKIKEPENYKAKGAPKNSKDVSTGESSKNDIRNFFDTKTSSTSPTSTPFSGTGVKLGSLPSNVTKDVSTGESSKNDIRNFFNTKTSSTSPTSTPFSGTGDKLGSLPSNVTKGTLKNHNLANGIRKFPSNSSSSFPKASTSSHSSNTNSIKTFSETANPPTSSSKNTNSIKPFSGKGNRLGSFLPTNKSSPVRNKKTVPKPTNAHSINNFFNNTSSKPSSSTSTTVGIKRKFPFEQNGALNVNKQQVSTPQETVGCPACGKKVLQSSINTHLDSCLNGK